MSLELAVGRAIAQASRPLVYGGGAQGLMGAVSGAALQHGGHAIGVVPYAMVAAGGEKRDGYTVEPDRRKYGEKVVSISPIQNNYVQLIQYQV
jgi:predicted Rossmann-fold nucleotide-binding protein